MGRVLSVVRPFCRGVHVDTFRTRGRVAIILPCRICAFDPALFSDGAGIAELPALRFGDQVWTLIILSEVRNGGGLSYGATRDPGDPVSLDRVIARRRRSSVLFLSLHVADGLRFR